MFEEKIAAFFMEFRLQAIAIPLQATGVCKQHTAPRASFTCHTLIFSREHVAQVEEHSSGQDLWIAVHASVKESFHLIHVSPHLA